MILYLLGFRRIRSYISYASTDSYTSYNSSSNYSTLQKGNVSDCPCMVNNYTCIPDCCCAPKCSYFYNENYTKCYPAPTADLVTMCSSVSKDQVGTVSDWLSRVIFCVYRENNPLTSRGITYEVPNADYENDALNNTIASLITSSSTSYNYLTESDALTVTGANKTNRGYLFGQNVLLSDGTNFHFNSTSDNFNIGVEFGMNLNFEFDITNGTLPNSSIAMLSSAQTTSLRIAPNVSDTINIVVDNSNIEQTKFLGLSLSIFYKVVGYKEAPQYILSSATINTTTTDYPEGQHAGSINGTHVVGYIGFYELPNSENLLQQSDDADENSWLPFNWRGVNLN